MRPSSRDLGRRGEGRAWGPKALCWRAGPGASDRKGVHTANPRRQRHGAVRPLCSLGPRPPPCPEQPLGQPCREGSEGLEHGSPSPPPAPIRALPHPPPFGTLVQDPREVPSW